LSKKEKEKQNCCKHKGHAEAGGQCGLEKGNRCREGSTYRTDQKKGGGSAMQAPDPREAQRSNYELYRGEGKGSKTGKRLAYPGMDSTRNEIVCKVTRGRPKGKSRVQFGKPATNGHR